jgi:hypothetical protein
MNMWMSLNLDLIEQERRDRNEELRKIYEGRRAMEIAGYQSPGTRLRARAAGLLLRLAVALDKRIAEHEPEAIGQSAIGNGQWAVGR